jgi:hypothetical protein
MLIMHIKFTSGRTASGFAEADVLRAHFPPDTGTGEETAMPQAEPIETLILGSGNGGM